MPTYKSQKEKSKVDEALEEYGQPISFEKVWLMFQETDRLINEQSRVTGNSASIINKQSFEPKNGNTIINVQVF